MDKEIEKILKTIDVGEKGTFLFELRQQTLKATTGDAQQIIKRMIDIRGQHFVGTDWVNKPYYYLFEAFAQEVLHNHNEAIDRANTAALLFHTKNSLWNETLTYWFIGVVYRNNNCIEKAEDQLKRALETLERLASLADQRFNYQAIKECESQINRIRQGMKKLPSSTPHLSGIGEPAISYRIFSQVIGYLEIPPKELYHEWLEAIYSLDPSELPHINQQIDILINMQEQLPDNEAMMIPLVSIFLAHCHNSSCFAGNQNSISAAVRYAEDACAGFQSLGAEYNQILSDCYLELIHGSVSDTEKRISHLYRANQLLEELLDLTGDSIKRKSIVEMQIEIQASIKSPKLTDLSEPSIPQSESKRPQSSSGGLLSKLGLTSPKPKGPDSTPLKTHAFTVNMPQLQPNAPAGKKPRLHRWTRKSLQILPPSSGSSSFYITIPVDTNALLNPGQKSEPLEENLYESLKNYNKYSPDEPQANQSEQDKIAKTPLRTRFAIPSFSIYGRATAGPEGKINFEEPECASGVTEDYYGEFAGIKHKVYSTDERDRKITIVTSRTYGWLQIEGESMNMATPVPIHDHDYVLFYKIEDLECCEDRVVIASKPGSDEEHPLLMIKRLVALVPKTQRADNTGKKYFFHSESSRDAYKKDIEFTEANQLIGEVVAVAKPVK